MKNLFTKYIPHGLMVMVVIISICALVARVGYTSTYLDPMSQVLNNFNMTDTYFQIMNDNSEEQMDVNFDVVMYDISGCYSRSEIAFGIQRLYDLGAKVIALDVIFGPNSQDTLANDSLQRVINRCKDRVIAACRMVPNYDSFIKEESYFVKESGCAEGCVNISNETVREFSKTVTFGDTTLSTYVNEIMKIAYPEVQKKWEERTCKEELINYKHTLFEKYHIYEDLYPEDVKDKIFLMGDFQDLRDFHDVPVKINGSRRICGTTIHGYSISTLTKDGRLIDSMTDKEALILGFIVTLIFCIIYCWLNEVYNDYSGFLSTSLQLIIMLSLVFVAGYLFIEKQYNVKLLYALLGTGLAGYAAEIFYFIWLRVKKMLGQKTPDVIVKEEPVVVEAKVNDAVEKDDKE